MKYVLTLFFLFAAGILAAADWLIGAEYRLEIQREQADKICAIDLRRILLPEPLTHGVVVTNDRQEPVNFYLDDRQCLFFPPAPAGKYYVYFGFPQPVRNDCWDREKHGDLPQNQMLTVKLLHAWGMWPSEAEWLTKKIEYTNRRYTNNIAWHQKMLFWQSLANAVPVIFTKYSTEHWLQLHFYRQPRVQQERYNRFQSLASRAQMWRFRKGRHRRAPVFRCGTWFPFWIPSLQRSNTLYRPRGTIMNIRKISENWRNELAQHRKNMHGAPERELVERFKNPKIRSFGTDIAREINLPKRAFDAGGVFACSYTGALHVPASGKVEFGITSNSLTMLQLGDELITVRSGKSAPDEVVCRTITREMKEGLYPFALYYLKTQVTTHLTMTWKKPGDAAHTIINDLAFRPAIPVQPTALVSRKNAQYPVVEREDRQDLFYGKLHKAELAGFNVLAPADLPFHWLVNGEKIPGDCLRLALPENPAPQVQFVPQDRRYQPLPVFHSKAVGTRLAVDAGLWLHPDLPMTIKHDEELSGYLELRSRLTVPVCARLRTRVTGAKNATFSNEDKFSSIPAKLPEELDRFAEDRINKETLLLKGKELRRGLRVEWEASIPGLVMDRRTVHFLPVNQLPPDLAASAEGFVNGSGERVIPVLQRPSLHELRKGESWQAVRNTFSRGQKLLIITEDFGTRKKFSKLLENACRQAGWEPEVLCWKNTAARSGSRMQESIPDLLRAIHGSPADTVLLIPPAPSRDKALPIREQLRLNALILEKLRNLPNVRKLYLATPFPAYPETEGIADETAFRDALPKLAREYGAAWFAWGNVILSKNPDYRNMFGDPASGVIRSLPDAGAEKFAEQLAATLPRK